MTAFDDDRVAGALLGLACGDAPGAGYEFGSAPFHGTAAMIGGGLGGFAPGEWTDDTSMAVCIAQVTATGTVDLGAIAERFLDRYGSGPPDIGNQTRAVLGAATEPPTPPSPASCSAHGGERPPSRPTGGDSSTAGPGLTGEELVDLAIRTAQAA